jgi:hypothetical protein
MSFDPITAGMDLAGKVIDKIFPDPAQRDAAKLAMLKQQQDGEFKQMDIDFQLQLEQIKVDAVEASNASVFVSGWRPGCGWVGVAGLAYTFIGQPLLAWGAVTFGKPIPPVVDTALLMQLVFALLGLGGLRSFEKIKGVSK